MEEKSQSTIQSGTSFGQTLKELLGVGLFYLFGIGIFVLFGIVILAVLKWAFGIVF